MLNPIDIIKSINTENNTTNTNKTSELITAVIDRSGSTATHFTSSSVLEKELSVLKNTVLSNPLYVYSLCLTC